MGNRWESPLPSTSDGIATPWSSVGDPPSPSACGPPSPSAGGRVTLVWSSAARVHALSLRDGDLVLPQATVNSETAPLHDGGPAARCRLHASATPRPRWLPARRQPRCPHAMAAWMQVTATRSFRSCSIDRRSMSIWPGRDACL
ncbi:hypothetical protein BRADI_3g51963v3 [Brachypodium distachyon]|uniref:Uncharacterized protein n=1 Tax=Brachypodium distachyon TaxID=15368 RepID=A0A0Q3QGE0_BRADI|nr:hypothetical protein BRADI_3g51963v3 [Brachypodium distachyon]